jgi:PAS domain S-box-containing protein
MKDEYKTKRQLISELQELRERLSRCESAETQPISGNGKIEESLRKSEERFRALTESTSDWIWETDKDGRYTYASPRIEELLGYAPEEVIGRTPFDFMSQDEAKRVSKIFRDIVQTRRPFTAVENTNLHKNGKEMILETSGIPIFNAKGELAGYRGIDLNITERKRSEEKLNHTLSLLEATIESTADGILVVDRQGRMVKYNQKFAKMWNIPRHILESRNDNQALSSILEQLKDPKEFTHKVMELYSHPEVESCDVVEFADGRVFERYSHPQRIGDEIIGRVWSFRDVTERRRVEGALKESEERFRATFEQAAVGVAHICPDGRFLLVNQKFCDIVGYTRDELLEKTFQEITYPYDLEANLENIRMLLLNEIQSYAMHKRYMRKDGSFVWINLTVSLVRTFSGEPEYFISVIEDISAHKKLEEQLFQAQKMEAVGRLAGGIAHDFNNLLTAVIGYGNLLKAEVANDSSLGLYATQILNAAEKAALLTRDLLTFGRKHITNLQPVNMNKILTNMENLLTGILGRDIEFSLVLSGRNVQVFADPAHLEQAVMNLAINARDAMPDGGRLLIKTDIVDLDAQFIKAHGFGRKGSYVLLSFEDTGMGMDADTRGRIFEPFFTTKEVGKGTGLGLAIVYGIVKQHDGFITVYSEPGTGTSFKIFLPLISREDTESTSERDGIR